jgi:hypothetical protein
VALQKEGPHANCWLTESIAPVGAPGGCASAGDCGGGGEPCPVPDDWGLGI